MSDLLFLYATHDGQTQRICAAMAEEARQSGRRVEILSLTDAQVADALARTTQVVIGAAIRYGHLPKALYAFIAA